MGSRAYVASALLLGAALAGAAFGAASGTELTRTTIVEVLLVLASGVVIAAAILFGRRGPLYGGAAVLMFLVLAVFTALAVLWSVVPELTYIEAGRTFAYVAVFAAAIAAARLAPRAAPAALGGITIAALVTVLYALASRVWPGALAADELSNRIGLPFEYWNAVGTAAAMAVPGGLWIATRRTGSPILRAAAYPALGVAVLGIQLTQSRGALLAAAVGALLWVVLVPLRLRSLPAILMPAIGGALVAAWALSKDPFSKPLQPLAAKESVAGEFGLLIVLLVVVLFGAGLVVNLLAERGLPPVRMHRRIGLAAVVVAIVVPLLAVTSVALSDRGLGDRWSDLTSETITAPAEGAGRIATTSNTRGKYWREAGRVFGDRPVVGSGPGTFEVTRLRERTDQSVTAHAHGFVAQALADTGIVGTALSLLVLVAWLVAALRTTGFVRRSAAGERRDWSHDRIALVALALVVVVFGVQSTIDWTWFVPAIAAMALVAAGFVAGRGPALVLVPQPAFAEAAAAPPAAVPAAVAAPAVAAVVAQPQAAAAGHETSTIVATSEAATPTTASEAPTVVANAETAAPTTEVPMVGADADTASTATGPPNAGATPEATAAATAPSRRPSGARIAAAVATVLLALLCAWVVWQPEASDRAAGDALDLIEAGRFDEAAAKARAAASDNPLTPQPLWVLAAAQTADGDREAAARTLEQAVLEFPGDPESWLRLGRFQLEGLDQPREALSTVRGALYLDPKGRRPAQLFFDARIQAREDALAAAQAKALRDARKSRRTPAPATPPADTPPADAGAGGQPAPGETTTPGGVAAPGD